MDIIYQNNPSLGHKEVVFETVLMTYSKYSVGHSVYKFYLVNFFFTAVASYSMIDAGALQPPAFPADPVCSSCPLLGKQRMAYEIAACICISQQQGQHRVLHIIPWAKKPFGKAVCKE